MKTRCEHCGQDYEVDESMTGVKARCGVCAKNFVVSPSMGLSSLPAVSDTAGDGDLILGLYLRKGEPVEGGMGKVFRVHHTAWNVDLAMKQPHAELFETEAQKQNFIHECEAWINLGLHPHIVSCHYVREIDGVPNIFAEWMDGGSLSHWISSEKLYEGDEQEILKRILDIAIQFAWGLDYAHEQGLIHQDVKPDNVLLNSDGMVKVADFGISNAKSGMGLSTAMTSKFSGTMVSAAGAYTPAYCSPEQSNSENLTRRTDIWSWAVSVMEMFIGERLWQSGVVAGAACDDYFDSARLLIPESVKALLRECFKENEAERPRSFKIIADKLLEIYHKETGETYRREAPKAAAAAPDALNNRALSYVDMGQFDRAEQMWTRALKIDPSHLESTYNHGLYLWRSGKIDDMELLRRLEALRLSGASSWQNEYLLAKVHLGRGDAESALPLLESVANQSDNDPDVVSAMQIATEFRDSGRCLRTFSGHTSSVSSVSFSPDGKFALSGAYDNTIKLWDVSSGQCLRTFAGHTAVIASVRFSPDGKMALSGGVDKNLKLWDVASGQCSRTFSGHTDMVYSVGFSPDGKQAISGSSDKSLRLWHAATGQCLRTITGHRGYVTAVSFSPDGNAVLSGSYDNTLKLWDAATGQCLRTFEGHADNVITVSFSPDGKYALSGSSDKNLKLWEVESGRCLLTFHGHAEKIRSVSFSPDGRLALSCSDDSTLKLWNVSSGQCLRTFAGHTSAVCAASFSPEGKSAISCASDKTLKLWDLTVSPDYADWALCRIRTALETLDHEQRFVAAMENAEKKTAAGDFAAALTALADARSVPGFERSPQSLELNFKIGRRCRITGLQNGWLEHTLSDHTNSVRAVSISPDGKLALSGSKDRSMKLWDAASGQCLRTFDGHENGIEAASFSPDGKYALSGSGDQTLKLWDATTGQCLRTFTGHAADVTTLSFSPDGKYALSGSEDKTLKLWGMKNTQCRRTYQGHTKIVTTVSFSPDGKLALSGSLDRTLKLWEVQTGECLRTLDGHKKGITAVSFSPDGKSALSGSSDNTLKLWDVASGQCFHTFHGHTEDILTVNFSPDGRFALSGSEDHTLKLWDVASGQCLRTFDGHSSAISAVSVSPDGRYALSGSGDNTLKLWRLDWKYELPEWADWDDGAEPYLHNFLTVRNGKWNDDDFKLLINNLQNRGYGWLKPDGVKRELEKMTAVWQDSIPELSQKQPFIEPEIGMQFVYVEPGSFQMGLKDATAKSSTAGPPHPVTISNGYWMGKYEVTQDEYQSIIGSNPSCFKGGRKPVEQVRWDDAVNFCQKLTELERAAGRLPSEYEYRLPTEAEWEYAARGGNMSKGYQYSGSDNLDSVAWYGENSGNTTHDVGTKLPNELGIYDMTGNVDELCQDDWHDNYNGAPSDGSRWGDGTGSRRMDRGGNWCCKANTGYLHVAHRGGPSQGTMSAGTGIRVAVGPIDNIKASQVAVTESAAKPLQKVSEQTLQHDQPWTVPNLNMQFVYVKPGSFQMGSNENDSEKPVHQVTISNGYWLGKYEVTQDEYQSIIGSNPSNFKGGRKPVDSVSWNDAVSFCQKLTELERTAGRLLSGYEYRLPTEAEWEFAARGGTASKGYQYSGSDNPDSVAWYDSNSGATTHDVGTKSPNELGIYDMSGNVWEWCQDDWHSDYKGAPSDGNRWGDGTGSYRVCRGGSWDGGASNCGVAIRSSSSPGHRGSNLGLRVAVGPIDNIKTSQVAVTESAAKPIQKVSEQTLQHDQPWTVPNLNMQFVYVKPGSFQMGSNEFASEKPVHSVTLSNGYWLGKYEVTQDEYQSIIGSNPSNFKGGRKPVEQVSWDDAVSFCQKLTERERSAGRLPSGYEYRLPTEAEWEFAARGGNMSKGYQYSGSDNIDSVAWYGENSGKTPHDVGTKSPNELGIYDMSGNVLEWCLDDWHSDYKGAPSDGDRWGDGSGSYRVHRGGDWLSNADRCRVADRSYGSPGSRRDFIGFRVALASSSR